MQTRQIVRALAAALSIGVVALALMGATAATQPGAIPMVGVPTGEFANGVEVQRLPSITVTARRSDAR